MHVKKQLEKPSREYWREREKSIKKWALVYPSNTT
jgi:hypothetical protein